MAAAAGGCSVVWFCLVSFRTEQLVWLSQDNIALWELNDTLNGYTLHQIGPEPGPCASHHAMPCHVMPCHAMTSHLHSRSSL